MTKNENLPFAGEAKKISTPDAAKAHHEVLLSKILAQLSLAFENLKPQDYSLGFEDGYKTRVFHDKEKNFAGFYLQAQIAATSKDDERLVGCVIINTNDENHDGQPTINMMQSGITDWYRFVVKDAGDCNKWVPRESLYVKKSSSFMNELAELLERTGIRLDYNPADRSKYSLRRFTDDGVRLQ